RMTRRLRWLRLIAAVLASLVSMSACGLAQKSDPNVLAAQANADSAAGNWSACISDFTSVLAARPSLVTAYSGRAACYLHSGDFQAAVQDYTKAIAISN